MAQIVEGKVKERCTIEEHCQNFEKMRCKDAKMTFGIFYGSVRESRQGINLARFLVKQLQARGHKIHLFDAKELKLPLLDKMYKEYKGKVAPEPLEEMAKNIKECDGYIIVSGEYNHSIPPGLTNMMDYFMEQYFFKPSGIATYSAGPWGGVRAAMQCRSFLGEVGTVTIPTTFPVPSIQNAFDQEGNDKTEKKDYERRVVRFLQEFEWYAHGLKEQRKLGTPY